MISTNDSAASSRYTSLDTARGITMLLIIAFHVLGNSAGLFHHFVASMCLHIFFFISGFFFRGFRLKKDLIQLVMPYAVLLVFIRFYWCIRLGEFRPVMLIELLKQILLGYTISEYWPQIGFYVGILWFLPLLFCSKLIYTLIHRLCPANEGMRIVLSLMASVAGIMIGDRFGRLPWSADVALAAQAFFCWGEMCSKRPVVFFDFLSKWSAVFLVFLLWLVLVLRYGYGELAFRLYPAGVTYLLASSAAVYIVLSISQILTRYLSKVTRVLSTLGQHSFLIFCAHTIDKSCITDPAGKNPLLLLIPEMALACLPVAVLCAVKHVRERRNSKNRE